MLRLLARRSHVPLSEQVACLQAVWRGLEPGSPASGSQCLAQHKAPAWREYGTASSSSSTVGGVHSAAAAGAPGPPDRGAPPTSAAAQAAAGAQQEHAGASGAAGASSSGGTSSSGSASSGGGEQDPREALLEAALPYVHAHGWGVAALRAAAQDLGLSLAAAGLLGSEAQFAQAFVARCNRQLEQQLAGMGQELTQMPLRDRLRTGLRARLELVLPYVDSWPQALGLLAQPAALPRTLQLYAELADAVAHAAGDSTMDGSWYVKRAALSGVYVTTELYALTDTSPGFADTWAALERRVDDALALGKAGSDVGSLAGMLGGLASSLLRPRHTPI